MTDFKNVEKDDIFSKLEVPYSKSKDDVWESLSAKIESQSKQKKSKKIVLYVKYMAAAVVALLFISSVFARIYSMTVVCPNGEKLSHTLPDGSVVEMNSGSTLSYNPYWWNLNRKVTFEGEAFFDIEKGKKFRIISPQGTTEILGTSFNIYARNTDYKVFCKTGKVRVSNDDKKVSLVLNPNEIAVVNDAYPKGQVKNSNEESILGWKNNVFSFNGESLNNVFEELGRQFNTEIKYNPAVVKGQIYTGYFAKTESVEEAINYICTTYNLTAEKINEKLYVIYKVGSTHGQ